MLLAAFLMHAVAEKTFQDTCLSMCCGLGIVLLEESAPEPNNVEGKAVWKLCRCRRSAADTSHRPLSVCGKSHP
jgi:hypothetical protein